MNRPARSASIGAAALCALLLGVPGCTDLGESPVSAITPETFYRTEAEVISGLASVYAGLRASLWAYYNLSEVSTDEIIVPTRGNDWFDGGRWLEIHRQTWAANSPSAEDINAAWNDAFTGVARANALLEALENVVVGDEAIVAAEVRTLRAFYYYMLMDLFGGVPIVETTEIAARPRNTRKEVFEFIESELNATRTVLPETWPPASHGRVTQGAANAILASMYLNAEVFTGEVTATGLTKGPARWQDAVTAADRILNSGKYSLATDFHANFRPDNHASPENILVAKQLNRDGLGLEIFYRGMHYNSGASGAWNGFATLADVYYAYDTLRIDRLPVPGTTRSADLLRSNDKRHQIFLAGQHYNVDTGAPVNDRSGVPLFFTPEIRDARAAAENEGVRIYKWPADANRSGSHHNNDYAYFRLSEIYLIKAEAQNELGQTAGAITLVNQVRERAFDPDKPVVAAGLTKELAREAIRRERLMELTAEAKRRQDLIRYGRYTQPWTNMVGFGKTVAREPYRILMPIPRVQLDANPQLTQNPGY
jgi:starch-binding outer membrane protein, SusD/RagB family